MPRTATRTLRRLGPLPAPQGRLSQAGLVLCQVHHTDEWQIPVILVQIQTVAKDKPVGNGESAIMDWNGGLAPLRFVEQRTDLETCSWRVSSMPMTEAMV